MPRIALDAKTEAALLLARGTPSEQVGKQLGINGRTVRRWRDEPDFEALVQDGRRAILAESVAALGAAAREAVETLRAALTDESANVRVRAAGILLSSLPAIAEHAELNERLATLEAAAESSRRAA